MFWFKYFHQITLGLSYLHINNIIHRDIKPENFLFERKGNDCLDIKMIDFGLAKPYIKNGQLKNKDWTEDDHVDMLPYKTYGNRAF